MRKDTVKLLDDFTRAIGLESWSRISSRCRGKFAGRTDYGVVFNNGSVIYFSQGMKEFHKNLEERFSQMRLFIGNKQKYLELLQNQVNIDNSVAQAEGLHRVTLVALGLWNQKGSHFLWPYVEIFVRGRNIKHTETNLKNALFNDTLSAWSGRCAETFTAGGVDDPDYIFGNVRFSTEYGHYRIIPE